MPKTKTKRAQSVAKKEHLPQEQEHVFESLPAPEFAGSPEDEGFAWLQWSLIHSMGIEPDDTSCWRSLYLEMTAAEDLVELLSDEADVRDTQQMSAEAEAEERY